MQTLVDRFSYAVSRLDAASDKVSRTSRRVLASTRTLAESAQRQNETTEAMAMILKGATETHRQLISITEDVAALSSENVSSLLEVKAMGDEIVTGMETLFRATEISLSNVAQMTQTSKTMAAGSGEALERVESISASVEEVTASVKEVERNARSSAELAEAVRSSAAKEGVEVVAVAIEGMGRISNVVSITVDQVKRLHDSSLDIQRILSVIREITEQTNLLSLNASILAEKAGEHGKGFSVVAEEMRSLSGRTASYTREISGIVKSILGGIEDTVEMINASAKMVGAESDKVYNVGETVSGILEAAHNSASMAQSIEHATVEQARAPAARRQFDARRKPHGHADEKSHGRADDRDLAGAGAGRRGQGDRRQHQEGRKRAGLRHPRHRQEHGVRQRDGIERQGLDPHSSRGSPRRSVYRSATCTPPVLAASRTSRT